MAYELCDVREHFDGMEIALMEEVENASHAIEATASAFWQAYLHRNFPRPWQLLCEQGPDDTMRRVDMKVILYNQDNHTLAPILWIEVKRKKGSRKEAEEQGLDAADKAIDKYNLTGVYVFTAIGLTYRAWYVNRQYRELEPLHGSEDARWEYLHVAHQHGILNLESTIQLIKGEQPYQQAPVVPSQQTQLAEMLQAQGYLDPGESSAGFEYSMGQAAKSSETEYQGGDATHYQQTQFVQAVWAGHGGGMSYQEPLSMTETQEGDEEATVDSNVEDDEPSQSDIKGKQKRKERKMKKVKVQLERHILGKDKCVFWDANGKKRTTLRSEWKEKREGGNVYFEFKGKSCIYRCKNFES
ncbi:hypothetical protein F66182_10789 [Fusarium sp. NRRL 66182]|nr:hypothetical protein F66182_10789 [Fusarium sp. NRRL 66182]